MFPKNQRLVRRADFNRLFKHQPFFSDHLIIRLAKNSSLTTRFSVVVSTKISKLAVVRNRIKRQIREAAKKELKNQPNLKNTDILVIVKKRPTDDFDNISKEVKYLINKATFMCR